MIQELLNKNEHFHILQKASKLADSMDLEAYLVGGYVRDLLLGRELTDIDIMVNKESMNYAKELSKILKVNKTVLFEKFLTARIPFSECEIEISNARKEEYEKVSRKPSKIVETTIREDIIRRDFTINTLAVSLNKSNFGELIDLFNGIVDLNSGLIKTPSDPDKTFKDDPLRMLRAIRFAAQLEFKIDEDTAKSIEKNKDRLEIVSQERITAEIFKILKSKKPSIAFYLLKKYNLLKIIFPEMDVMSGIDIIDNKGHKDVFIHTLEVVDNAANLSDKMEIRFAALVHDIAKPNTKRFNQKKGWTFHGHDEIGKRMLVKIAKRMKLSNELRDYLMLLTKLHLRPIALAKKNISDKAIRRLMFESGKFIDDLMILCRADITTKNKNKVKKYLENFDRVEELMQDVKLRDEMSAFKSPVDGYTIMKTFDLKEGFAIGKIKSDIEDAILDEKIENTFEAALEYMMSIKDKYL